MDIAVRCLWLLVQIACYGCAPEAISRTRERFCRRFPTYNPRMPRDDLHDLADPLAAQGFRFAPAQDMRAHLGALADWGTFSASWNDLPRDVHLPDGHRYRRRRHATLSARAGESTFHVEPPRPHYQA